MGDQPKGNRVTETTELAVQNSVRLVAKGHDVPDSFTDMQAMARALQASKMIPKHLQGDEASIMSIMIAARALDIPMWPAMQQLIVIEGKTGMSATLMQALVLRAGYRMGPVQELCNEQEAVVRCQRPGIGDDGGDTTLVRFTLEDAMRAKLVEQRPDGTLYARSKDGNKILPWEKYGPQMLKRRAASMAARDYYPDVLNGMVYTPDEIGAAIDEEGNPVHGAGPIRLEVDPRVEDYGMRIIGATTQDALRDVYEEISSKGIGSLMNLRGQTLTEMVTARLNTLRARDGDTTPPAGTSEKELAGEGTETPTEPDAAESTEQPTGDDVKAEPDPEDTRINDDEREALCDLLGGIHEDGWPGVEADVLDQRGLHPDQVATEWLQDYAQRLVDTQKGQQK